MSIPKVGAIKQALLETLQDDQAHRLRDLVPLLAQRFQLTPEDLAVRHATGALKFENRVRWARQHLKDEDALVAPDRGMVQITPRGQELLRVVAVMPRSSTQQAEPVLASPDFDANEAEQAPEDVLDTTVEQLTQRLCNDVLERVREVSPQQFERLVVDVLLAMGYGFDQSAGHVTRYVGDGGIDGLVHEDKLGLSTIFIQAKRYQDGHNVGRPDVQQFLGALTGAGASKGVFITSASFTREAREFAARLQNQKVVLMDGAQLARRMVEHDVGVTTARMLAIKHLDSDYFDLG
ncbi:restriction endonuclease [Ottowia sp.]|uniref:restriction endonuclease n=1 Tax=Ottowia sp. TaxID=1898956 RepID=UPI002D113329|nr:restriction endonuclease [Pseudomonadota bacterium]HOV19734.1 restriction endonuclease [Ottowia sp.]